MKPTQGPTSSASGGLRLDGVYEAPQTRAFEEPEHRGFAALHRDGWRLLIAHPGLFVLLPVVAWLPVDGLAELAAMVAGDDFLRQLQAATRIHQIGALLVGSWLAGVQLCGIKRLNQEGACTVRQAVADGNHLFRRMLITSWSAGWRVLLGFIFLIVPGIYAAVRYGMALPIAAFRGLSGREALAESNAFMTGHAWQFLGVIVLVQVIYMPIQLFGSTLIALGLESAYPQILTVLSEPLALAPMNVLMQFGWIILPALFYMDRAQGLEGRLRSGDRPYSNGLVGVFAAFSVMLGVTTGVAIYIGPELMALFQEAL